MWVPGPGAYLDIGPRSWPGRAREGRDISGDCIGEIGELVVEGEGLFRLVYRVIRLYREIQGGMFGLIINSLYEISTWAFFIE